MEFNEAAQVIRDALTERKLCVVVGNCLVRYSGRAASKLSEGDRLLIVKPDGTFLVHQGKGMAAINYQGPGATVTVEEDAGAGELVVTAKRAKPLRETIETRFKRVDFARAFDLRDDSKLKRFGSERELASLLSQDLDLIERGLTPVQEESTLPKGAIDILARDALGHLVVIEVKRRDAGLDAVTQLSRYVAELRKRKGEVVRGVLCSPHVTPNALKMLEENGFEWFKLDYEATNPGARIRGLEKKQKTVTEF
ncbi:MAG: endonuclease NucS [Candidatus Norongarragalinales archaeon]